MRLLVAWRLSISGEDAFVTRSKIGHQDGWVLEKRASTGPLTRAFRERLRDPILTPRHAQVLGVQQARGARAWRGMPFCSEALRWML